MKLTVQKKMLGKGEKAFPVYQTRIFSTDVRLSKAFLDELKKYKPESLQDDTAIYDIDPTNFYITATQKNGYTNVYLTLKKDPNRDDVATEEVPF